MMDRGDGGSGRGLRLVLWMKIAFTVIWAAPLLLAPIECFAALGFPRPEPMIFARLLGAGRAPIDAVAVGIVSNGLAAALLVFYGVGGAYGGWGTFAKVFMWASAAATGLVAAGLIAFRPR